MKVQDGNNTQLTGSDLDEYLAKRFPSFFPDTNVSEEAVDPKAKYHGDPKLKFHGWANYQTWNVALWLQNDEGLYGLACQYQNWGDLKIHLPDRTPDGVWYEDENINIKEINDMLSGLLD